MFVHFLVFALAVTSAVADHHKVTCNNVTPSSPASLSALSGGWVGVETVRFKDGHAFIPDNDITPTACLHGKAYETTETGLKVEIETNIPDRDVTKEQLTLHVIGDEKGRLSAVSSLHDRENWEFVVLDSDPEKHLVYMLCQPPNSDGERLPFRINLLGRHTASSDHSALSAEELSALETKVGTQLGLTGTGIKPVKLTNSCWAHYGEHHHH
ncbi:hypothetical protein B566_EDAN003045 [Ephemera danica]|nr:hypothetical protein B566_EDAN003045 [Ephemera danica]